jgi:hypothetical protein
MYNGHTICVNWVYSELYRRPLLAVTCLLANITMRSTKGRIRRAAAADSGAATIKRENFKLPERTAKDLERISQESGITKTEVVRQGIALMRVCWDESKAGNRLVVQNAAGETVKELVLP